MKMGSISEPYLRETFSSFTHIPIVGKCRSRFCLTTMVIGLGHSVS